MSSGFYSPDSRGSCDPNGPVVAHGEWMTWPEQSDRRKLCRSYLLDGSADILTQSMPYLLDNFGSILRYEAEPGVYGTDSGSDFEEDDEKAACLLAAAAEVHLESTRPRVLSHRRYVEVLALPLDVDSVSDLLNAEATTLNSAAGAEDVKLFLRLMLLWSGYIGKLGARTYVYYALCELEAMAKAWSHGDTEEQFKRKNLVLSTSALAREPFQQYHKGVFSDPYLEKVNNVDPARMNSG